EGVYMTDVIVVLFRASLGDIPNGHICLSMEECQSLTKFTCHLYYYKKADDDVKLWREALDGLVL
ncbi:6438_t:CDS:2, partial [Entrophospora sp. SA101]